MKLKPKQIIGKHIIIGLTYLDSNENIVNRVQLHGDVISITDKKITIKLNTGEEFTLPPDISSIEVAPPGDYRFKSTGEVIVNPDLMTTWTIYATEQKEE